MENVNLGRKVVDHLTLNPQELDMGTYGERHPCGTIACLAGHTMLQAGYTLVDNDLSQHFIRPDGTTVEDEAFEARELLGISDVEYYWPWIAIPAQGNPGATTIFAGYLTNEEAFYRFKQIVLLSEMAEAAKEK